MSLKLLVFWWSENICQGVSTYGKHDSKKLLFMQEVSGYYQRVQGGVHFMLPAYHCTTDCFWIFQIYCPIPFILKSETSTVRLTLGDLNGKSESWILWVGFPAGSSSKCRSSSSSNGGGFLHMSSLRKEVDGSPPVTSWKLWKQLWGYYVRYVPKSPLTSVLCFESKKSIGRGVKILFFRLVVMSGYASHPTMVWIGDAGARHAMFDQLPLFARCSLEAQSHPVTQRVSQFMYRCRYIQ